MAWPCVDVSLSLSQASAYLLLPLQNTYWWVDRERGVCAVVWTNVLPFGAQAIHDLWAVLETELYKGLPA